MFTDLEHPVLLVLTVVACIPLFRSWAALLFGSWKNALASIRWLFVRDRTSFVRGEYVEDKFAEIRLAVLLLLCGATVLAVYTLVARVALWLGT